MNEKNEKSKNKKTLRENLNELINFEGFKKEKVFRSLFIIPILSLIVRNMNNIKESDESIYPSKLFAISELDIKHKDILNSFDCYRYLGLNLCEAISFLFIETIFREYNIDKVLNITKSPLDILSGQNSGIKLTEKEKAEFRDSYCKLSLRFQKYIDIMVKNGNQAFYEIIYHFYLICQTNDQIKIASKLFLKNSGYNMCIKRKMSQKEMKKLSFLELFKENLLDKDLSFLAENLGININVCYWDSKNLNSFNYKEKNFVEKPNNIKILQKNGKFYGLFKQNQKINLDNLFFEEKNLNFLENSANLLNVIEKKPKNIKVIYSEPIAVDIIHQNEKESNKQEEKKKNKEEKKEEKAEQQKEIIVNRVDCCICHNAINNSKSFINPSCNHIYCYSCIVDKCEKKQYLNLCLERICTKTLALPKLEKFLLETSLNQTSQENQNFEEINFLEYEQECYYCQKTDKILLESFMQFEYYKCYFCHKTSCILHKAPMEKCFCFCLKCFEQTNLYENNTKKRCYNCKEIYCIICSKISAQCTCYCQVCGEVDKEFQNEYCVKCTEICKLCKINYNKKYIIKCQKGKHFYCKFCAFKDKDFFLKKPVCIICKY